MNFKKIIIGIIALVAIVGVALGVKSQFSHKDTSQERGNSLVENSSTNTSNIDTSNIVKEELYAEGQGKKYTVILLRLKIIRNKSYQQ